LWLSLGATVLLVGSFILGYLTGVVLPPVNTDKNLAAIEEAYQNIVRDYVEPGQVDRDALSQAAIQAMVDALGDPYSAYLNPDAFQRYSDTDAGVYGGIGAEVAIKDSQVTIVSVYSGSPAEAAGIRAGDVILEVDGVSTEGMSTTDVVALVRGDKGTGVSLLIQHQGEAETLPIEVVRAEIQTASVEYELMGDVAYISLEQFGERSDAEMAAAIKSANEEASGIILDLRGNPGGGLQTVINIASRFITDGVVLTVRFSDGETETHRVVSQDVTTELPMVVLVDGYSASASEVLSGALQDHQRAVIAGETTYGKGSVNYMEPLPDGSAIYITAARWLTPDGHLIKGQGITPDYELEADTDWVQWALDYLHGLNS
jgi:carboxyl-terminal processing protease